MAYEMVMPYHLHMPSYFLETFTEYPYKSFDTDEACRTRTAFNLKSELETSNNSFKTVIDR